VVGASGPLKRLSKAQHVINWVWTGPTVGSPQALFERTTCHVNESQKKKKKGQQFRPPWGNGAVDLNPSPNLLKRTERGGAGRRRVAATAWTRGSISRDRDQKH